MRNLTVSLTDAVKGLAVIVSDFGTEHVATRPNGDSGCVYAVKDHHGFLTPVCIVGQYIARLGLLGLLVVTEDQSQYSQYTDNPELHGACVPDSAMWRVLAENGVTFEENAQTFLRSAQNVQDSNDSWGNALFVAYRDHKEAIENSADGWAASNAVADALRNHTVPATLGLGF